MSRYEMPCRTIRAIIMNIYQEKLLDHYKHPRHHGILEKATFTIEEYNPSCGDRVTIYGIIKDGKVEQLSFTGTGCVISQAATSMLLQNVMGKPLEVVSNMQKDDILKLIGISLGPTRLRCALLGLEALKRGLQDGT